MKKVSLENGQYLMRFDCGADDFYFDSGNMLYAADALLEIAGGQQGLVCIYGGFGCGKTHLLKGFYRDAKSACPGNAAAYISAKCLSEELMAALCTGTVAALADRYASYKLLVVEDTDILLGKEPMQNIFFQLFEHIIERGCSIVMSAAVHPDSFPGLYPLFALCGGMIVELGYPNAACRRNFAEATCVEWGVYITLEEAEMLADSCTTIPQLRSAIFSRALKAA